MMKEKNLPKSYWAKATNTVVYLMNWCTSRVHDITPYENFYGKKSNLSHIRIFGSITFVHIPDEKQQKLDPKLEKCILVGYSLEQKVYKCFNSSTRKVRVSRDVVFDESASWYLVDSAPSDHPIETDFYINSEWTTRALERPKHVMVESKDGEREGKNS